LAAERATGEDSVPHYRDAIQQFEKLKAVHEVEFAYLLSGEWTDPRHDERKQALDEFQLLIPEIREAASHPGFDFQLHGASAPIGQSQPDLLSIALMEDLGASEFRAFAVLLAADMRDAARSGRWQEFE